VDESVENLDDMTNKTQKTIEEVINQSEGGVINEVDPSGVIVGMEGSSNPETNGTQDATEGVTIDWLQKVAIDSSENTVTVNQIEQENGTIGYRYEFSVDHPNEKLRGMVAVYERRKVKDDQGRFVNEYTNVVIGVAQTIAPDNAADIEDLPDNF
jgi:hypothetical protein